MLRYLRIAFSVVCIAACLAIVALWVRSYSSREYFLKPVSNKHMIVVESASGRVMLDFFESGHYGAYWGGVIEDWREANRDLGIAGFAYAAAPWHTTYRAPHWFLVMLFAALATIPWLHFSKRFSLRTLLVAMTLAAVGLGVVVSAVR